VQYRQQSNLFKIGLFNQNKNNGIAKDYVEYLQHDSNFIAQNKLTKDLQNNYAEFQRIYVNQNKFTACFDFVESVFNSIIYVVIILMSCYLMINGKHLNVGTMTLLVSLSAMMSSSINSICGFAIKKIEYTRMSEIYRNFIEIDNIVCLGKMKIERIKSISYKNKNKTIILKNGNYSHDDNLINALSFNVDADAQVLINEINLQQLDYQA
jgi:ABC-type bacteriocin/lantibiotic exporter with double-glycine peptidase domain